MLDETDIQKLLRLKRYEQPPAGYHERFLQEFHRRQRAEMLRQPLWKLALERLGAFFSEHSMGRLAYGSATMAVLLFTGVASYRMVINSPSQPGPAISRMAQNQVTPAQPAATIAPVALAQNNPQDQQAQQFPLRGRVTGLETTTLPRLNTTPVSDPHYVIGARPVSYERSFSF